MVIHDVIVLLSDSDKHKLFLALIAPAMIYFEEKLDNISHNSCISKLPDLLKEVSERWSALVE